MSDLLRLRLDHHGVASLDGTWEFFPNDIGIDELATTTPEAIEVPGLWEAQGWIELDGAAWYRRQFDVADHDAPGWWTLRFGAVMDLAEVYVNGTSVASHDSAFTPFEADVSGILRPGGNVIAVRVVDPARNHPDHLRSAHGKQGWANHVFPSRPSLYMTYGGIWQSVTLRRHGPVRLDDIFVNSDPDDLRVTVVARNVSGERRVVRLGVRTVGVVREVTLDLGAGQAASPTLAIGSTVAPRWSPDDPVLHRAWVDVVCEGDQSDARAVRYGLRTLRIEGTRLLIGGQPYRMKSVLVQGFRADELYAEGDRGEIVEEVLAAKAMGFNTLRLHIKAFHPTYLDVCDELGMLLHCDLPVAEPIAHDEMGADTELTRRCLTAIREQVRRDRNHPSIILWSAMNELTLDRLEARSWDGYEAFARALAGAVADADPTRPFIENDWVEPEPERVFVAPVLTAHWYGRLHAEYLDKIERDSVACAGIDKPLYITEFGDWGLPDMPELVEPPFWDTRAVYATGLAGTLWPATVARFVVETQRYQGLSDRLQAEVFRRHDHLGGYCVTELTDVPHELNGLLDLHRRPKKIAVAEITRANQPVLPILRLESLVMAAGSVVEAPLCIANDGPALVDVGVDIRFGNAPAETATTVRAGDLPGHGVSAHGSPVVLAPDVPGSHDLILRVTAAGAAVAENRYPIHVVTRRNVQASVQVLRDDDLSLALAAVGATVGDSGPLVVGEGALDEKSAEPVRRHLIDGGTVVVLAQGLRSAPYFPLPVGLEDVQTKWGSSEFHFTTDHGALPTLPRRNVLVAEDSTIQARAVVTSVGDHAFPEAPVVIAYKPVPGAITGTVVGSHPVGAGRLVLCQYRLVTGALAGDAAALGLLGDVVAWAADPPTPLRRDDDTLADGRTVRFYSW